MKTLIFKACVLAASMFTLASCDDFLTEDPKGKLTPDNYFQNQKDLDMSVYALYSKIQGYQCNSNTMIVQCQGDDVTSTTGSNKAAYLSADAFEPPTDAKGVEATWKRLYTIIKVCNSIIDNAAKVSASQEEKDIALGQAYYWRAYSYFGLVRVYGALPLILHNLPDNNQTPLTGVEGIYSQIVDDLTAAEACNLPAQYTGANRSIDGQNIYVSQQTVKATLAAVYMSMAGFPLDKKDYYAKAADKAEEVIVGVNNGTYPHGLLSDWRDVYNYGMNHHFETLLGIDYNASPGSWGDDDSQLSSCHQLGDLDGWGDFLAERAFWAGYPDGPRKEAVYASTLHTKTGADVDWWATVDGEPYDGNNAVVGAYRPMFVGFTVNKAVSGAAEKAAYDCTLPFWGGMCLDKRHQLIRYSEVICWYAESAARAGRDLTLAKSELKKVRARACSDASLVSEIDGMTAAELAEAACAEHGYEVAGNVLGMVTRRDDQLRTNTLKAAYDYRTGSQSTVLVRKGTLTRSSTADGTPFTYALKEDLVLKENMPVTAAWQGDASVYHIYPPTEVEKNPNLRR